MELPSHCDFALRHGVAGWCAQLLESARGSFCAPLLWLRLWQSRYYCHVPKTRISVRRPDQIRSRAAVGWSTAAEDVGSFRRHPGNDVAGFEGIGHILPVGGPGQVDAIDQRFRDRKLRSWKTKNSRIFGPTAE